MAEGQVQGEPPGESKILRCLYLQWRILSFTVTREELLTLGPPEFAWGLLWVWIAGMGRVWDDPTADMFARLGLPSLIYVFVLATGLWLFIKPVGPNNWRYGKLLTYITMTALPAVLYAIPVETFLDEWQATEINSCFLIAVATWRVLMLGNFVNKVTELPPTRVLVCLFLPLALIVNLLLLDRSMKRTFMGMGGIRYMRPVGPMPVRKPGPKGATPEDLDSGTGKTSGDSTGKRLSELVEPEFVPTPHGPVRIYSQFSWLGDGQIPEGFVPIEENDPNYFPPNILTKFLNVLSVASVWGFPPLFLYYLWCIVSRERAGMKASTKDAPAKSEP